MLRCRTVHVILHGAALEDAIISPPLWHSYAVKNVITLVIVFDLQPPKRSAERERKSLYTGIEKFDLELAIGDGLRLSDQLVEPLFGHCAVASFVDVNSAGRARRLSIDQHAKFHGRSRHCRERDRKSTRLNSSHSGESRMPSSA